MINNEKYIKELEELRARMEKAELWGNKMPLFMDEIINKKLSGDEGHQQYSKEYKKLYLAWGVNRSLYGSSRDITNYVEEFSGYLWCIYINTISIYDSHDKHGLEDISLDNIFFYDKSNTTFYATDEQIGYLLESLNDWYMNAIKIEEKAIKEDEILKLEKKLAKLKD